MLMTQSSISSNSFRQCHMLCHIFWWNSASLKGPPGHSKSQSSTFLKESRGSWGDGVQKTLKKGPKLLKMTFHVSKEFWKRRLRIRDIQGWTLLFFRYSPKDLWHSAPRRRVLSSVTLYGLKLQFCTNHHYDVFESESRRYIINLSKILGLKQNSP